MDGHRGGAGPLISLRPGFLFLFFPFEGGKRTPKQWQIHNSWAYKIDAGFNRRRAVSGCPLTIYEPAGVLTSQTWGGDHTRAPIFYLNIIKSTQSITRLSISPRLESTVMLPLGLQRLPLGAEGRYGPFSLYGNLSFSPFPFWTLSSHVVPLQLPWDLGYIPWSPSASTESSVRWDIAQMSPLQ